MKWYTASPPIFRKRTYGKNHQITAKIISPAKRGTADSVYRIQYDAPSVQYLTIYQVIPSITALITLCSMIYVTARFNFQLACVAMGVAP
ncbi:MAG: hypothetical protein ACE5G8_08125, partial [Anaerolineae bacterium]